MEALGHALMVFIGVLLGQAAYSGLKAWWMAL